MNNTLASTTLLAALVGGDLTKQFGAGQPCLLTIYPNGTSVPQFSKNTEGYFSIDTLLDIDIMCLPANATNLTRDNANKTDYLQATTMQI